MRYLLYKFAMWFWHYDPYIRQGIQEWYKPPEPDINICPGCGGPADNGFDRMMPPNPYYCSKCDTDEKSARERRENDDMIMGGGSR